MAWRWFEYIALFWIVPVALFVYRDTLSLTLIPLVCAVATGCVYILWRKGILPRQWHKAKELKLVQFKPILSFFGIAALALLLLILIFMPSSFLTTPFESASHWLLLFLCYPLFSVLPQELIFRSYFFYRYRKLFVSDKSRCLLSSFSFGFAHLLYANWIAVVLSFFGGLLFSYRFVNTQNIALVVIEHSLWGCFIFASGLGSFFIVSHWF